MSKKMIKMKEGYLELQKVTPSGLDQASLCDELRVRICFMNTSLKSKI